MYYSKSELEKSIGKLEKLKSKIKKKSYQIGYIRLVTFFGTLLLTAISFFSFENIYTQLILILGLVLFILISVWQSRFLKFHNTITKWLSIKKSLLSRSKLDWANIKRRNILPEYELSSIEIDLNLSGERSLTHLIDFSSSNEGTFILRDLLCNHVLDKKEIEERQNIVKELVLFSRFRERFLLILSLANEKVEKLGNLKKWLDSNSNIKKVNLFLYFLIPIAVVNISLIVLQFLEVLSSAWMISSFVYVAIYYLGSKHYNSISQLSDIVKDELGRISKACEFIDSSDFSNYPHLKKLCEPIQNKETNPSQLLNQILRIANFLPLRKNPFAWFSIALIFPIDFYITRKLEKCKIKMNDNYEVWKNALHHLEAYNSIATFAILNEEYKFPKIIDDKFQFEAEKIGHPLISKNEKIENSFKFSKLGDVVIITGSNMSGKSTFLQTLGINICLAYAGAPVNALELNFSPLRVFSCIKVSDSVIDGISYFYSEVKRLKLLLEEYEKNDSNPIIFFIDEIFKGTNNIERRIGSSAFIKSLIGKNGIGFVTTHDLDLVKLSENNKEISNYHFKENIKDDKMEFDYTIHDGPCPTTNALHIMKIEGLPTEN